MFVYFYLFCLFLFVFVENWDAIGIGLLDDLFALLVSVCKCIKNIWNTFTFIGKILRKRFLFCVFVHKKPRISCLGAKYPGRYRGIEPFVIRLSNHLIRNDFVSFECHFPKVDSL